ncbi:MAG: hypothetical protein KF866_06785 [Phycisphaeraceae bacterium]|nr:hypothetical protein [Phycisphaeraceae bacterium]
MRARGSAYVLVLGATAIIGALAIGAAHALPSMKRSAEWSAEAARARLASASALELSAHVALQGDFRETYKDAVMHTVAGARVMVEALAPDGGKVEDDPDTDVLVRAEATVGKGVQTRHLLLEAKTLTMNTLTAAIGAQGTLTINGVTVTADAPVVSGNTMVLISATLSADAGATTACLGSTYGGRVVTGIAPNFPGEDLIEHYRAQATSVSLPGNRRLEKGILAPGHNTFGAANANGVYVIDCGGQNVTIQDVRIVGTLVVVNPGSGSSIKNSVLMTARSPGQPVLLVLGSMNFDYSTSLLRESTLKVNFNPSGVPYNGVTNNNTSDSYPSIIDGFVYVHGDLTVTRSMHFRGVLLAGGNMTVTGDMHVEYRSDIAQNPPPLTSAHVLVPGGWAQPSP